MIRTFTITIGKVYNGTEECKNPHVELAGKQHIAVNCIDPAGCKYSVQLGPNDIEPCLTFLVRCSDCDTCGTKVIKKCFCDSVDDCGSCEICDTDGFCAPTCPHGICKDGICYECDEKVKCACNQVCGDGECKCPPGTKLNDFGCCDECQKDGDCDVCDTCIDHGSYNACKPKDCNCDGTGKCGTKGACVECTNSGQCPPHEVCNSHCGCVCAPGYKRINGICTPTDCPNGDEDCGVCEICVGTHCIPNQCPAGKVPVEVNGVCSCVEECNCDQPNCSSRFNFCGESSIPGKCGCQPCTGNCDTGCDDPCICDEHLNKCKFNPCFGSCESGLDCGPTCGCKDGECVPCDVLECTSDECARTLGCTCSAIGKCVKDACDSSPCSVAADCSLGCTCDGGVCNACSNFSCNTSDCSDHDGCVCSGGECVGDANPGCKDSITLTKDDGACTITGTLVKEKCCQCPAITLDVKTVSAVDKGTTAKTVVYRAEVRKGAFDGISVDSNPLVDAFTNPNIAENEPPTAGTIRLNYSVSYKVFDIVNGKDVATGLSTVSNKPSQQVTYVGGVSQKDITVELPRIGVRTVSGTQALVVEFIELIFSLETKMVFPNTCEYASGTEVGKIKITSNDDFVKTPIGTTIKSEACRLPFIKWTKFPLGSTTGNTFRKLYLPATEGNTYIDTIDGPKGAESCFTYLFEPDCSCDDPAQQYIVFCNPVFNKPVLEDCGKKAKIVIDAACTANQVKDYELWINSETSPAKTFKLNAPQNFDVIRTVPITSIRLHMKCDSIGQCDTEYTYPENKIEPIPQGLCKGDGTVSFTFDTESYPGGISSIIFDGVLKTSNFVFDGKLPNTNYKYKVTFSNGCVSDEKTANQSCCVTPTLECSTGGKFHVITGAATGVKYNGVLLPSDGIIVPPSTGTSSLTYVCDNVTKTVPVPTYANGPCCNIVLVPGSWNIDATAKSITLAIATTSTSGNYTVSINRGSTVVAGPFTMTNNGISHTFTITSTVDESLTVEIKNADTFCKKSIPVSFDKDGCDLGLLLSKKDSSCALQATTKEKTCSCDTGTISGTISSVTPLPNNQLSATFAVAPIIGDSSEKVVASSLQIYVNGGPNAAFTETLTTLTPSPIVRTIDAYCSTNQGTQQFTATAQLCQGSHCGGETHLLIVNIPSPYIVTGITMGTAPTNPAVLVDTNGTWWVKYTPTAGNSIVILFKNTTTSDTYSFPAVGGINPITLEDLRSYSLNVGNSDCYLCGGTVKGADIRLVYTVTLEDGCVYTGELSKRVCAGSTATLNEVALTNTNPTEKKMKFKLFQGTTLLKTDYRKAPSLINYSSSDVDFKPGQEYKVTASCNCDETATNSECFNTVISKHEPTGSVWGSNCNKTYGIRIESCYPGEQIAVKIGDETKSAMLDIDGGKNIIFNLGESLTTDDVSIDYWYPVNGSIFCSGNKILPNALVPKFDVSYACNGTSDTYTATVTAIGGGNVVILDNPPGVQFGTLPGNNTITGVTSTDQFQVHVSLNGSCAYKLLLQHDCSCNLSDAMLTSPSTLNVCVFNTVASAQSVTVDTHRTDSGNDWWAALGSTAIGEAQTLSTATILIRADQLLDAAPNAGTTIVNLNLSDDSGGTVCKSIPITINRTDIQYSVKPTCNGNTWSVTVSSTTQGVTLTNNSAGTKSGLNIFGISNDTHFVTFKVNKGTCSKTETVQIPPLCAPECSESEILIKTPTILNPCSISGIQGTVILDITTSNAKCPITNVYSDGELSTYFSTTNGHWYVNYPVEATGSKLITADTNCGCRKTISVQLAQSCCAQASSVSLIQTSSFCRSTGGTVNITVTNPLGYTLGTWSNNIGTWTTAPSSTGGVITIDPGAGDDLRISVPVLDGLGNTCFLLSSTILGLTDCGTTNKCINPTVICGDCQQCNTLTGKCDYILQGSQGPCDIGDVCCFGSCTASCVPGGPVYTSGCNYSQTVCSNGLCGPIPIIQPCYTADLTAGSSCDVDNQCYIDVTANITRQVLECPILLEEPSSYLFTFGDGVQIPGTGAGVWDGSNYSVTCRVAVSTCADKEVSVSYNGCLIAGPVFVPVFVHCLDCNPCLS